MRCYCFEYSEMVAVWCVWERGSCDGVKKVNAAAPRTALPQLEAGATRARLGMTTNELELFACDS